MTLVGYRSRVSHDFRLICKKAVAPLQTPIIILGGILVGVYDPDRGIGRRRRLRADRQLLYPALDAA